MCKDRDQSQDPCSCCPKVYILSASEINADETEDVTIYEYEALETLDIEKVRFVRHAEGTRLLESEVHPDETITITIYDESVLRYLVFTDKVRSVQRPDGMPLLSALSRNTQTQQLKKAQTVTVRV